MQLFTGIVASFQFDLEGFSSNDFDFDGFGFFIRAAWIRFLTDSVFAKSSTTWESFSLSPWHSECHRPPPNGGSSYHAILCGELTIFAAPFGQPGSAIGVLPLSPRIIPKEIELAVATRNIAIKNTLPMRIDIAHLLKGMEWITSWDEIRFR